MSIPRAKIRRVDVPKAGWECFVLRIPEGSIQPTYFVQCEAPECDYTEDWWSWDGAAKDAREHLRDAHGVRTVGSLTAQEIGKWIDLGKWEAFRITKVWHGRRTMIGSDGLGPTFTGPPSTPCRVTKERP